MHLLLAFGVLLAVVAARIPGARLVVYEDAAHGAFLQERRDFLRRLDRFLG